jgi:hypothetical protein
MVEELKKECSFQVRWMKVLRSLVDYVESRFQAKQKKKPRKK